MGWDGRYLGYRPSRTEAKQIIDAEFTWSNDTHDFRVIKSTMVGNTYYGVMETCDRANGTCTRYAMVVLTSYDDGEFCTKAMGEDEEPYYYDMPVTYLDLLTPPYNEYAANWRRKVRENADVKKRKWEKRRWKFEGEDREYVGQEFAEELGRRTGYPAYAVTNTRWIKGMKPEQEAQVGTTRFKRVYARKPASFRRRRP